MKVNTGPPSNAVNGCPSSRKSTRTFPAAGPAGILRTFVTAESPPNAST